jgi:ElaB/YqjD/DUF883 family membrane-anchored ribosome-binding protein
MAEGTGSNQTGVGAEVGDAAASNPDQYSSWDRSSAGSNAQTVQDRYEQAKRAAADSFGQARQTIKDASQQAQQYASGWTQQTRSATEDYVRDKPWNAVGIAAAIGVVIGLILRR